MPIQDWAATVSGIQISGDNVEVSVQVTNNANNLIAFTKTYTLNGLTASRDQLKKLINTSIDSIEKSLQFQADLTAIPQIDTSPITSLTLDHLITQVNAELTILSQLSQLRNKGIILPSDSLITKQTTKLQGLFDDIINPAGLIGSVAIGTI